MSGPLGKVPETMPDTALEPNSVMAPWYNNSTLGYKHAFANRNLRDHTLKGPSA